MEHRDPNSYVSDVVAAKILGCGVQSTRNWRFQGRGPAYSKKGRMVRYKVQDLYDFMDSGRVTPGSQETMANRQDGQ